MAIDRKNGPSIKKITELNIPLVHREILKNGIELIEVNMGTQNLVQIEVLFRGGRILEKQKGASRAVARLLKEGTRNYTGSQLAEEVDFYGANISSGASLDYSYVKIFTLNKHFQKLLPILDEVIYHPVFLEEELRKYKENSIQKLKVELAKSELVAYKSITERLYGEEHPYGYNSSDEIYRKLDRDSLMEYYNEAYGTTNCVIIVSGNVTENIRTELIDLFGNKPIKEIDIQYVDSNIQQTGHHSISLKSEDEHQTAVKIGMKLFKRGHPDFADMFILNTILGGYFGSRLMSSLREEKGYTYNIYSSMDMMIYGGYFNISTEVGNKYIEQTIACIYEELEKLKNELVGEQELAMVKNYLSGNFLNMIDGPFKVAGMYKVLSLNGLDKSFYEGLMARIHTIQAEDIRRMARKYFLKDQMVEVLVGNP